MITFEDMAVQVGDSNVTIGAWFMRDENDEESKRFTPENVVMPRDEAIAIAIAKAILANVSFEETLDDYADRRAAELDDYAFVLDCAQDISF